MMSLYIYIEREREILFSFYSLLMLIINDNSMPFLEERVLFLLMVIINEYIMPFLQLSLI